MAWARLCDQASERRIHQVDRREENAQSAISCIERKSERSRENQKERLPYLAARTAGITARQIPIGFSQNLRELTTVIFYYCELL